MISAICNFVALIWVCQWNYEKKRKRFQSDRRVPYPAVPSIFSDCGFCIFQLLAVQFEIEGSFILHHIKNQAGQNPAHKMDRIMMGILFFEWRCKIEGFRLALSALVELRL
jgi:hypothetical protein